MNTFSRQNFRGIAIEINLNSDLSFVNTYLVLCNVSSDHLSPKEQSRQVLFKKHCEIGSFTIGLGVSIRSLLTIWGYILCILSPKFFALQKSKALFGRVDAYR